MTTLRVANFSDQAPHFLGKTEAHQLLAAVVECAGRSGLQGDIRLDFTDVEGISPSGARVFLFGVVRQLGEPALQRMVFFHVPPGLADVLESAVTDATSPQTAG